MAKGLTKKQEAFVYAYIKTGNATDAYRTAYDTENMAEPTLNREAVRLLNNPKVATRIEEIRAPALAKAGLSIERTLQEVARLAYSDPRKMFRGDGTLIPIHELDDDTAAMVASIEHDTLKVGDDDSEIGRTTKLKVWDKNAALEKAMKHLGLYEKDNKQRGESLSINVQFVKVGG